MSFWVYDASPSPICETLWSLRWTSPALSLAEQRMAACADPRRAKDRSLRPFVVGPRNGTRLAVNISPDIWVS